MVKVDVPRMIAMINASPRIAASNQMHLAHCQVLRTLRLFLMSPATSRHLPENIFRNERMDLFGCSFACFVVLINVASISHEFDPWKSHILKVQSVEKRFQTDGWDFTDFNW